MVELEVIFCGSQHQQFSVLAGFPSPVGTEKQDQCCQPGQQVPKASIYCTLSLFQEELAQQLDALQTRTKQMLLSALPGVTLSSQQVEQASPDPSQSLLQKGRRNV